MLANRIPTRKVWILLAPCLVVLSTPFSVSVRAADATEIISNAIAEARKIDPAMGSKFVSAARVFIAEPELIKQPQEASNRIAEIDKLWFSDPRFVEGAKALLLDKNKDRDIAPKIVGGHEDTKTFRCVAVGTATKWIGSGVLVSPNVVLTAAHVRQGKFGQATRVWIGPKIGDSNTGREELINWNESKPYPNSNVDMAVLVLRNAVNEVEKCPRATEHESNRAERFRSVGYGSNKEDGSGQPNTRREALLESRANPCGKSESDVPAFDCKVDIELVAGGFGKDTCKGDSGGPAFTEEGDKLAGITVGPVLYGENKCGLGGIFVRTAKADHAAWIDQIIARNTVPSASGKDVPPVAPTVPQKSTPKLPTFPSPGPRVDPIRK